MSVIKKKYLPWLAALLALCGTPACYAAAAPDNPQYFIFTDQNNQEEKIPLPEFLYSLRVVTGREWTAEQFTQAQQNPQQEDDDDEEESPLSNAAVLRAVRHYSQRRHPTAYENSMPIMAPADKKPSSFGKTFSTGYTMRVYKGVMTRQEIETFINLQVPHPAGTIGMNYGWYFYFEVPAKDEENQEPAFFTALQAKLGESPALGQYIISYTRAIGKRKEEEKRQAMIFPDLKICEYIMNQKAPDQPITWGVVAAALAHLIKDTIGLSCRVRFATEREALAEHAISSFTDSTSDKRIAHGIPEDLNDFVVHVDLLPEKTTPAPPGAKQSHKEKHKKRDSLPLTLPEPGNLFTRNKKTFGGGAFLAIAAGVIYYGWQWYHAKPLKQPKKTRGAR